MNIRPRSLKRKAIAEINVVPYIDVMLVLLVIFMITTPLLSQGVKVDLPKAKAQSLSAKDKEPIIVSVNAQGQYFLNIAANPNAVVSEQDLQSQVSQALAKNGPDTTRAVLVKADQSVNYGVVVKAMTVLQAAGAPSVGLVTQTPNTPETTTQHNGNAWRAS